LLLAEERIAAGRKVVAFPISDLTANPLRPHYDVAAGDDSRAFLHAATAGAVYGPRSSARLFHLEDEPIERVPYTLLVCHERSGAIRFSVCHGVRIGADGALPGGVPPDDLSGLRWWAACPPLLAEGRHDLEAFALRDYDLRHVFGFPQDAAAEDALRAIYRTFPDWDAWCDAVRARLETIERHETGYHAALGVTDDRLIVAHRTAAIPDLAGELRALGARDAVLLDSGGSCAVWASWANGGQGGVLASHWNFRPARGAVVFLELATGPEGPQEA
jgi:hypothetical protein